MTALEADLSKLSLQERPQHNEHPGQHPDGGEVEEEPAEILPFRFFDLPSEIRLKIYNYVLFGSKRKGAARPSGNVGSSSKNKPLAPLSHRVALFLASRRIHDEASVQFYSVQTFRVFQIQDYSRLPTLTSLAPTYRPLIKKIELILGSSWTAPPKSWKVTNRLGLAEMTGLQTLKIFIQCDPSHPVFEGFRISSDFYTGFAGEMVQKILEQLPNLTQVEFDAWPSVQKNGALMRRLLSEVRTANKKILWGPERGWNDWEDEDWNDTASKMNATGSISITDLSRKSLRRQHVPAARIATLS
ncbi:hypothetical protein UA08_00051 [Talaromyces atroroseus]|uniref:F-box domain-containing protein n=1 Tax=Talaromyces atroroseus TaxID=1441469 RepID=A0A225AYS2_TALAT|nr:hypothetical protein UA08_00051 [Talaromyces atroroseus]OKL63604.1 hypothetical protein UA08_00051 [Talaromyces atroroseus]